jgi:hypothetical protein
MAGMRFRKLRIAFSAVCGVVCLLLIALWVRSYWWYDIFNVQLAESRPLRIYSQSGLFYIGTAHDLGSDRHKPGDWSFHHSQIERDRNELWTWFRFRCQLIWNDFFIFVPHWALVLTSGAFAAIAYFKSNCRFSLRSFLLATTLVALILGIIIVLTK